LSSLFQRGKDRGPKRIAKADSEHLELQLSQGEVEMTGIEAVDLLPGGLVEETLPFSDHNGVDELLKEKAEGCSLRSTCE